MTETRTENDSMGPVEVPIGALYGAQTQRAIDNFDICQRPLPERFITCLALLKAAAARANQQCGVLDDKRADALEAVALEIAGGAHRDQFPVSVFQTGSGTSTNMNMNEVLASLASSHCGLSVHPNDHANRSQSSNDMIPSCIQVAALLGIEQQLRAALGELVEAVNRRAKQLATTAKTGRTHLMDAMPLTLGQELGAWSYQLQECEDRFVDLRPRLNSLPVGGTAVGTGVNAPEGFAGALVSQLTRLTGHEFEAATNRFARIAGQDSSVECSSCLRSLAVTLTKINNDIRWMASGPLAGLAEIQLQALQPGSSIMPGKVNPVLPEATLMAAAEVIGNDACIGLAGLSGSFQLNVMLPLIADKLIGGIELLAGSCQTTARTIAGFEVNREQLQASLASNPMLVTALNAIIGYEAAAAIAKRAYREKRPVLEIAVEDTDLPRAELEALLDPLRLTGSTPEA